MLKFEDRLPLLLELGVNDVLEPVGTVLGWRFLIVGSLDGLVFEINLVKAVEEIFEALVEVEGVRALAA
jgi:hypothetical protein